MINDRRIPRCLVSAIVVIVAAGALLVGPSVTAGTAPIASGASCPEVEVVFARGRLESAGPGQVGNAFVSALRSKTGKNIGLYSVNYPADNQIDVGANDMSAHVQSMAANCPGTKLVLGGYSLGAGVTDVVLALPFEFFGFKNPLPADMDTHIAAVALFGNGSAWAGPVGAFNPVYRDRTIEMCHGDDPVCNPSDPNNWDANWPQHLAPEYIKSGMVDQAADFVAGRL